MLETLQQTGSDFTQIANHLETISTSLRLLMYMGLMVTIFYLGNTVNKWNKQ